MLTQQANEITQKWETKSKVAVQILAQPGMLRDSLTMLLSSFEFVSVVGKADCARNCLEEIELIQADIVLSACSSMAECERLMGRLQRVQSKIKCIVITDGFQSSKMAMELGADAALIKGFTSQDLMQVLRWVAFQHSSTASDKGVKKNND